MADERRATAKRPTPHNVDALLIQDALATWIPPAVAVLLLALATVLNALGAMSDPSAALLATLGLLILGAFAVVGPLVRDQHATKTAALATAGVLWVLLFSAPFALRLFPGSPIVTAPLGTQPQRAPFQVGKGRFDLVLDAHLPLSSEHQTRQLHYALTLTDGTGQPYRYDGELGDRWQTRRLGRRGTAPVHLEHLSASHEIDHPAGGTLRLDEMTLSGVPNATLAASIYRHRLPGPAWLLSVGIVLMLAALAFDLRWNPRQMPMAALLTATATGAVLVFCGSTAGHPGLRQVFGSTILGGITGVPTAGVVAWLARRSPWARAITSQRTS